MKSIVLYQDGEFAIKLGIRVIRVDVEKIRKNGRRSSLSKTVRPNKSTIAISLSLQGAVEQIQSGISVHERDVVG